MYLDSNIYLIQVCLFIGWMSYPQSKARGATTQRETDVKASEALREQLNRCLRRLSDVEKEAADKLRYCSSLKQFVEDYVRHKQHLKQVRKIIPKIDRLHHENVKAVVRRLWTYP